MTAPRRAGMTAEAHRAHLRDWARELAEAIWWEQLGRTLRRMLATVVVRELHHVTDSTGPRRALTLAEADWYTLDPTTRAELIAARNMTVLAMGSASVEARR